MARPGPADASLVPVEGHRLLAGPLESDPGPSWIAHREEDGRLVLLTVLREDEAGRGALIHARRAATVAHPSLLDIRCGAGRSGRLFVTVEIPEGLTLAALLRRDGALRAEDRAALGRPLAEALRTLASAGLGHGAIGPEAIVIEPSGHPRLRGYSLDRVLLPSAPAPGPGDLAEDLAALDAVLAGRKILPPDRAHRNAGASLRGRSGVPG